VTRTCQIAAAIGPHLTQMQLDVVAFDILVIMLGHAVAGKAFPDRPAK
jgi:hypothetical protein